MTSYKTSELAEEAFYAAFQSGDIDLMMSVWSQDENTCCIHPGGPRLEGWDLIQDSWQQIFSNEGDLEFEIQQKKIAVQKNIAIHHVIESISVNGKMQSEILATNIYIKSDSGWNMIVHHASPELQPKVEQSHFEEETESQTIH